MNTLTILLGAVAVGAVCMWSAWRTEALTLRQTLATERERADALVKTTAAEYERQAERQQDGWDRALTVLNEMHAAEIDRLINLRVAGVPAREEVTRTPAIADPTARARRQVREDAIVAGAAKIMSEYERAGEPITDAQARAQAERMLRGESPVPVNQ